MHFITCLELSEYRSYNTIRHKNYVDLWGQTLGMRFQMMVRRPLQGLSSVSKLILPEIPSAAGTQNPLMNEAQV